VLQVVLVLRLGLPEVTRGGHLGHHLAGPQARGVDVGDGVERHAALLVARVEDGRAVAQAHVIALAVLRARVVQLEEELEQLAEADALGVEDDFDGLGVRPVVAVRGIGHIAARVAHAGGKHAVVAPEKLLHAPEATAGEHRPFLTHEISLTWSRYAS
jgi:hypothetical protein